MNREELITLLKQEFPGKTIVDLETEIICETEPADAHSDWVKRLLTLACRNLIII